MKEFDILYTTNHSYINYLLVSLFSLLENNQEIHIRIHIVYDQFSQEDFFQIEKISNSYKNATIFYYDFAILKPMILDYHIPKWQNTDIANARLFFSTILPNAKQVLYLDSDTIIVDSLDNLVTYQNSIHMVKDAMPKRYWQKLNVSNYYNSGVLWINVALWQEKKCDQKITSVLKEQIPFHYPDQDILNVALKNEIAPLPLEYNLFSRDWLLNTYFLERYQKQNDINRGTKVEIEYAKKHPIIFHATTLFQYGMTHPFHPFYSFYEQYYQQMMKQSYPIEKHQYLLLKALYYTKLLVPKQVQQTVERQLKKR